MQPKSTRTLVSKMTRISGRKIPDMFLILSNELSVSPNLSGREAGAFLGEIRTQEELYSVLFWRKVNRGGNGGK